MKKGETTFGSSSSSKLSAAAAASMTSTSSELSSSWPFLLAEVVTLGCSRLLYVICTAADDSELFSTGIYSAL